MVLITTVDIGGGRSGKIEVRKGDEPQDAARAFCKMHGLPDSVVGPLTDHLLDHLRKAVKKDESLKVCAMSTNSLWLANGRVVSLTLYSPC